jgi:hypothetical protein
MFMPACAALITARGASKVGTSHVPADNIMLDGTHPVPNRGLNAIRRLGVRHNEQTSGTRFGDKHLKFVVAKMTVAWIIALRQHSAGCRDLDDIGTFAHEFAHAPTHRLGPVDQPTRIPRIRVLPYQATAGGQVTVAMPASLAKHRD